MKLYSKILRKVIDIKAHLEISSSDLVICEFPKSGITYFSFLLANYLVALDKSSADITFFNLNMYVQDLHRQPSIDKTTKFNSFSGRLLKSHAAYEFIKFPQKILIIRNPVKTLLSYYHHLSNSTVGSHTSFDNFVRSRKYGIDAWLKFYISHLSDTNPLGQALISFEQNVSDPISSLKLFCKLTGTSYCQQAAIKACLNTKIQQMANCEDATSRYGYKTVKSRFVGSSMLENGDSLGPAISFIKEKVLKSHLPDLISQELIVSLGLNT